ncbi:MAG: hypothetical protein KH828_03775 [Clostridiales bacterium]|nr:hypothetical protein [Clostridiales bacterium]
MLDEKKIRLMTKLARYENGQGKEDMRIARYYRSDYLGIALFKNFFLASAGYGVILLLVCAYFSEYLLDNVHKMNLLLVGAGVIGGYIITLTVYSVVTYTICSLRYFKAKRSVKMYNQQLGELQKFYE